MNLFRRTNPTIAISTQVASRTLSMRSHASHCPESELRRVLHVCSCIHAKKNTAPALPIVEYATTAGRRHPAVSFVFPTYASVA